MQINNLMMAFKPYYFYHIWIAKDKSVEVRKSRIPLPCKISGYCSMDKKSFNRIEFKNEAERALMLSLMGKVGGTFECNNWCYISSTNFDEITANSCLREWELHDYLNVPHFTDIGYIMGYGLVVDVPRLYDRPRELGEFLSISLIDKSWKSYSEGCKTTFTPLSEGMYKKYVKTGFAPKEVIDECRIKHAPQSYIRLADTGVGDDGHN